jgi:hypothetical protein
MNQIAFLFLILILAIGLPLFFKISETFQRIRRKDGFSNFHLDSTIGQYPAAQTEVLVQDTYPSIGKNQISNNDAYNIWWHYPTFKLGSYDQITNNIRYSNNPDIGRCMPASMCGALYHKKFIESNYVKPLSPVNPNSGTRVGYFATEKQLIDSLPYRSNMQNIMY